MVMALLSGDAERQVLLQATAQAAAAGLATRTCQILATANWLLGGHGYCADWRPVSHAVLAVGDQDALGPRDHRHLLHARGSYGEARAHQH